MKAHFPIFQVHPDLVYLDSAATAQKPQVVVDAERLFYEEQYATVHRGLYPLAARATALYESCRDKIRQLTGAATVREIVLTSGTTAAINLVAQSYLAPRLRPDHVVLAGISEHHANFVPWQQVCARTGARLEVIPVDERGVIDMEVYTRLLREQTVPLVAVAHISNSLGTIHPVEEVIRAAHAHGAVVLVDAAQSVGLYPVDVSAWDADFLAFSGHKMFGPSGTGSLYGKLHLLEQMEPVYWGGEMVQSVSCLQTTFAEVPRRFEAGTPNMAGFAGLSAAVDFVQNLNRSACVSYIESLTQNATAQLSQIEGLTLLGTAPQKSGIISFVLEGVHPHDLATLLGQRNICVRAGHHCTQPLMDFFNVAATTRISFSLYNTTEDIEQLIAAIRDIQRLFA